MGSVQQQLKSRSQRQDDAARAKEEASLAARRKQEASATLKQLCTSEASIRSISFATSS